MGGAERRQAILDSLSEAGTGSALSGRELAGRFGVSRQVVVQDIALMREAGTPIVATSRGYVLERRRESDRPRRTVKVRHSIDQIGDELCAIVDRGGRVLDVTVNHRAYGFVSAPLDIANRRDVRRFVDDISSGVSSPLMTLTSGYHFHLIEANTEDELDEIEAALDELGFLAKVLPYEATKAADGS
ncbi:MAG: transcription repressor NadR [Atopobiaceae bacterium]|nr:transcription repressor NadR [Atopobiaceae bacterium]